MSCQPTYSYRPSEFIPSDQKCRAPVYKERRARAETIIDPTDPIMFPNRGLFFRTRGFGFDRNNISIEMRSISNIGDVPSGVIVDPDNLPPFIFLVWYYDQTSETTNVLEYFPSNLYPSFSQLRVGLDLTHSAIEMPPMAVDINDDVRDSESNTLFAFSLRQLRGGSGGPTSSESIDMIRTGPKRTMIIISTTEDYEGNDVRPADSKRVQQWNGTSWVSYINNVQGVCPLDGITNI